MADADTQAIEVFVAQCADDVTQPVVAAMPAALLVAGGAGRNVQLIVGDQQLAGSELVKLAQCGHGGATAIHESGRVEQMQLMPLKHYLGVEAEELLFGA